MNKKLLDLKQSLIAKQKNIIYESDEDEGAAEYHAELQSIINVIDRGATESEVKAACEYVGETF